MPIAQPDGAKGAIPDDLERRVGPNGTWEKERHASAPGGTGREVASARDAKRVKHTGVRTADEELVVLHGDGRDAEHVDGLLWELRGGAVRGVLRRGTVVDVLPVWGVVGVAVLVFWGIMALVSMVWVHDTVLNGIAQEWIAD